MSRKPTRRERRAGWERHEPPPPVDRPVVPSEQRLRIEAERAAKAEAERERLATMTDEERAREEVSRSSRDRSSVVVSGLLAAAMGMGIAMPIARGRSR